MINWIYFVLQIAEAPQEQIKVTSLISTAGPVVKVVLAVLVFMSIVSWMIIFSKLFILRRAEKESDRFLDSYQVSGNFGNLFSSTRHLRGPIAELFRAGYGELLKIRKSRTSGSSQNPEPKTNPDIVSPELEVVELVERAMKKGMASEISRLEGSLIFLATTGSTAPFIGLFGTVWGAPGIAEALIATAVGLAAAIPAVVAYNYFVNRVKRIAVDMENFSAEFLNVVERYLTKM
jgi:biopolymer transport protein TolQ